VTVCHYPRGAYKWNPVEHRLFGPISSNWAGQPLRTLPPMLALIRGATIETGLTVRARWVRKRYVTGVRASDREMVGLRLRIHEVCPQWNYTTCPRRWLTKAS
jgi:hypothetical protein